MKRRLRMISVGLCGFLLVLTLAMWCRSYSMADGWVTGIRGSHVSLSSYRGTIAVAGFQWHRERALGSFHRSMALDRTPLFPISYLRGRFAGFRWSDMPGFFFDQPQKMPDGTAIHVWEPGAISRQGFTLVLPFWSLATLLLAIEALLLVVPLRRRRGRLRRGLCVRCGYDLRGSPGGACPECGAA